MNERANPRHRPETGGGGATGTMVGRPWTLRVKPASVLSILLAATLLWGAVAGARPQQRSRAAAFVLPRPHSTARTDRATARLHVRQQHEQQQDPTASPSPASAAWSLCKSLLPPAALLLLNSPLLPCLAPPVHAAATTPLPPAAEAVAARVLER